MAENCPRHRSHEATYRCAGCREVLCFDCVRDTGRLTLCALCGELAVALDRTASDAGRSGGATDGAEGRSGGRPEGAGGLQRLTAALRYPLRGRQRNLLAGLIALLLVVFWALSSSVTASCLLLGPFFLTLAVIALCLGDVVRSSSAGDHDLANWPDVQEPGFRLIELAGASMTAFLCLVPVGVLFQLSGCARRLHETGGVDALCLLVGFVGLTISTWWWLVIYGTFATLGRFWVTLRADQHWRSFVLQPARDLESAVVVMGILLIATPVAWSLGRLPIIGSKVETVVEVSALLYAAMVAAHFAGLRVRERDDELAAIYSD